MPVKPLMTWVDARSGWMKKYKRPVPYTRSAKQLAEEFGCPPTKTGSLASANLWWTAKQAEIDAADEMNPANLRAEQAEFRRAYVLDKVATSEDPAAVLGLLPKSEQAFVANYVRDAAMTSVGVGNRIDTRINANLDSWIEGKRLRAETKEIHPTRFTSYRGDGETMRRWFKANGIADAKQIGSGTVQSFFDFVQSSGNAPITRKNTFLSFKQFVKGLYRKEVIASLPRNLEDPDLRIGLPEPTVKVFKLSELRTLLEQAKNYGDGRVYLYLLLMLNCGFYQSDISELTYKTCSPKKGIILKARSKTGKYKVRYVLWPETAEALRKHRNRDKSRVDADGNVLVLVNANGGQLVPDCAGRIDNIATAYWNMRRAVAKAAKENKKDGKKVEPVKYPPLKCLRKTGTTLLGKHKHYRYFTLHYLADSPRGVESRNYRRPSNKQFAAALEWLRTKIFEPTTK